MNIQEIASNGRSPGGVHRRVDRIKASMQGSVRHHGASYPCLVEDVSDHGLQMTSNAPLEIGSLVKVTFHISCHETVECDVEVRRVSRDGAIGGEIMLISKSRC